MTGGQQGVTDADAQIGRGLYEAARLITGAAIFKPKKLKKLKKTLPLRKTLPHS